MRIDIQFFSREHTASLLNILNVETGACRTLRRFPGIIEAPNWLSDGDTLLYNADGLIYRYSIRSGKVEGCRWGGCCRGMTQLMPSKDKTSMAVRPASGEDLCSRIYILPMSGGEAKRITPKPHSYLHGWSKDGKELAYCAFRGTDVDIYTIPADGGEERRLTGGQGFNDGPEYAPNGEHIWFNSTRSGLMQIWRMNRDGSGLTQMTDTYSNNWFAHVSPDGKKVVYLAYAVDSLKPEEHLPNLPVSLWCMDYDGGNARKLTDLFGGQGTINVNSWSPDSKHIAFVSYEKNT